MKYNVALAGRDKDILKKSCLVFEDTPLPLVVCHSSTLFFSHFWLESNLPFDDIEKSLKKTDVSWFLADNSRQSTSQEGFPKAIKHLEQKIISCRVSALLNASFQEPGSLYVFDDYVNDSGSSSGKVTGREYFFDSENPVIAQMKSLQAIRPENTEIYLVILEMAFRDTPSDKSLTLWKWIASDIEALGNWYSVSSVLPAFLDSRGKILQYQKDWSPRANEKDRVFYLSKP